jgi:hypothetical protein
VVSLGGGAKPPPRAPLVCIEIWALWETNFFEQTLLLGARRPA